MNDVGVVRQHDHLGAGADSIARSSASVDGFMVSPPSTTVAPADSNSSRLPFPTDTATTAVAASRPAASSRRYRALDRLAVHVHDLDRLDDAHRRRELECAPGVVGVDVHLERRLVADDEQRVAERGELPLERRPRRARRPR